MKKRRMKTMKMTIKKMTIKKMTTKNDDDKEDDWIREWKVSMCSIAVELGSRNRLKPTKFENVFFLANVVEGRHVPLPDWDKCRGQNPWKSAEKWTIHTGSVGWRSVWLDFLKSYHWVWSWRSATWRWWKKPRRWVVAGVDVVLQEMVLESAFLDDCCLLFGNHFLRVIFM